MSFCIDIFKCKRDGRLCRNCSSWQQTVHFEFKILFLYNKETSKIWTMSVKSLSVMFLWKRYNIYKTLKIGLITPKIYLKRLCPETEYSSLLYYSFISKYTCEKLQLLYKICLRCQICTKFTHLPVPNVLFRTLCHNLIQECCAKCTGKEALRL